MKKICKKQMLTKTTLIIIIQHYINNKQNYLNDKANKIERKLVEKITEI